MCFFLCLCVCVCLFVNMTSFWFAFFFLQILFNRIQYCYHYLMAVATIWNVGHNPQHCCFMRCLLIIIAFRSRRRRRCHQSVLINYEWNKNFDDDDGDDDDHHHGHHCWSFVYIDNVDCYHNVLLRFYFWFIHSFLSLS